MRFSSGALPQTLSVADPPGRYFAEKLTWGPLDSPVTIAFELQGDAHFPTPSRIEIAERRGCDTAPIDPATPEGHQNLLAYVWPDQVDRIERLRGALGIAAEMPVQIDSENAAGWAERVFGERSPGRRPPERAD